LGGPADAFVAKLSPAGNSLTYSTYLGGVEIEFGLDNVIDGSGSAYVTGYTRSEDFPTVDPIDGSLNGYNDAFITKFSPAGNSLTYSTYLGGRRGDVGHGIAIDGSGGVYVTGETGSRDFPMVNPFDDKFNKKLFVTKLTENPVPAADHGDQIKMLKEVIEEKTGSIPGSFILNHNYPNPFNAATEIGFGLPVASHVTLEIFNILGQKVTTLVDGNYEPGTHTVVWNGSDATSGVYLYRIEAGNYIEMRKMLLIK
jgi:hypothetical protein